MNSLFQNGTSAQTKQQTLHFLKFTSVSVFTFLVAKQDSALSQCVCVRRVCRVLMCVDMESLCTSRSIDIRKLTTRSKRVAKSQSQGTGATPHSEGCPVQERPGKRKCWLTFRLGISERLPTATLPRRVRHVCMLQRSGQKKKLFEL